MKWEPGKTYTLRNGWSVTVWEIVPNNKEFPILGAYTDDCGNRRTEWWNSEGRVSYSRIDPRDLLPPEPRKRTVWVNLYGEFDGMHWPGGKSHDSKQAADDWHKRYENNNVPYLGAFPVEIVEK